MLSRTSLRSSLAIALIFLCRIFGLMAVLPVLTLYQHEFHEATAARIGLAIGAYGLTQALLQMPLGMWSDKIGRKHVATLGLLSLAVGSMICAQSTSVWGIILGRGLQGAGAIGSTLLALLADVIDQKEMSRAMMLVGITIGASFGLSVVVGPWLDTHFGIQVIFYVTAVLACLGIGLLWSIVPTPVTTQAQTYYLPSRDRLKTIVKLPILQRLNFSICSAHAIFTLLFIALPQVLHSQHQSDSWHFYWPAMLAAVIFGFPLIRIAEQYRQQILRVQITVLAISLIALYSNHSSVWVIGFSLAGFFTAFTVLEALLPSLVSRFSPQNCRGTAMGFFSTSQYLGIFLGGTMGGWLQTHWGQLSVWLVAIGLSGLWLLSVWQLPQQINKSET